MRKRERHGQAAKGKRSRAYQSWYSMLQRCCNPRCVEYKNYGARGIGVCAAWRRSFVAFFRSMGPRPSGRTLERIDNAKGYSPGNCRWATSREQHRNKRNNRLLTFRGETLPLVTWAERLGIPEKRLRHRIDDGWSAERALTTAKIPLGSVRGEAHWTAKLTERKAQRIREAYARGDCTQAEVARRFGVAQMTVSRIVRRAAKGGWGR